LDDLRPHVGRGDATVRAAYRQTLEQLAVECPDLPDVSLLPGETWLLLFEAPNDGCAVRLRASSDYGGPVVNDGLAWELRRAHRGLVSTVARARRQVARRPPAIELDVPFGSFEVEGSSLGLSVAIATLSATLGLAPHTNVAGSAQVMDDGRLRPVEHLETKLAALRRSWPEVTRVVVAEGQIRPVGGPMEFISCSTLDEAIRAFGLSLDSLPLAFLDESLNRVAAFRSENARAPGAEEWSQLSAEAWEVSAALGRDEPQKSAEAALWAALFAVHSGDPAAADALLRAVPPEMTAEFPELRVRQLMTSASNKVDTEELAEALSLADRAVKMCDALSAADRRELLGQALGTHGRALMHAGNLEAAESSLRRAHDHHRTLVPREAPRSACYLATCLRLAGRPADGLALVVGALAAVEEFAGRWNAAVTTGLFLRLERGRCLAALNQWAEAIADFRAVRDGQDDDLSYPRLGGMRGLAQAHRALHECAEADAALRACLSAVDRSHSPTLRKVAAIAAGDALVGDLRTAVPTYELQAAWVAAFGALPNSQDLATAVARWVY
jgi:tetratricopeptide (TPR) repeat protein